MNDDNIVDIITLRSKILATPPDRLYITEDSLVFGQHNVGYSEIDDISVIRQPDEKDYRSIILIALNGVMGGILSILLSTNPLIIASLILASLLFGYSIVKLVRNRPHRYISIKSGDTEYQFGVDTPVDLAKLLGHVSDNTEHKITLEDFM